MPHQHDAPSARRDGRLTRWAGGTAAGAVLVAVALAALTIPASTADRADAQAAEAATAPIRAAFYESRYPGAWGPPRATPDQPERGRYAISAALVRQHIEAMRYGAIRAGIAPWTGRATFGDRVVPTLLRAALGTPFRWSLSVTASRSLGPSAVAAVARRYGGHPAYLRIAGRPVVFVAGSGSSCAAAARWLARGRAGAYVMLSAFPGARSCPRQPDGWYAGAPGRGRQAALPSSFTISPAGLAASSRQRPLRRDVDRFRADVAAMIASGARFQLIDSFNRWNAGSAVESSARWRSGSGFGAYLDALHENGVALPPGVLRAARTVAPAPPAPELPTATGASAVPIPPPSPPAPLPNFPGIPLTPVAPPAAPLLPTPPPGAPSPPVGPPSLPAVTGDPIIAAAGDIACDPANPQFDSGRGNSNACAQQSTANLLTALAARGDLGAILTLGDTQYEVNTYEAFLQSFDKSWGRFKALIRPTVGNHEYLTPDAGGYFQYFGAAAGRPDQGYYSFDLGTWHLIALNSQCSRAGGCNEDSPQGRWLRDDLAAHRNRCVLAFWHIPLFSSGGRAETNSKSLWDQLHAAGADVILAGHDHTYERFAPQDPDGRADPTRGIREFVVGTGGNNHTKFDVIFANSEVRNADTFGVLILTLRPTSYDWRFLPVAGEDFTDAGTGSCH
jgi:acid phosphatase type 7